MTNADKFLKDGVDIQELAQELEQAIYIRISENFSKIVIDFFNKKISALTEDERVILRNIDTKNYNKICKDDNGYLYLKCTEKYYDSKIDDYVERTDDTFWYCYHELFQFIKERRRI